MSSAIRPRISLLLTALLSCLVATLCLAVDEPAKPEEQKPVELKEPTPYVTPPELKARLQKLLPLSYDKLRLRQPLHILAVGDDLAVMSGHGDDAGNQSLAWPAQFAKELGGEFVYSLGVRILPPSRSRSDKYTPPGLREITLRSVAVEGGVLRKAQSVTAAYGAGPAPDIILVGASPHDVEHGGDLMNFAESLHALIEAVNGKADLILVGPPLSCADPVAESLGRNRALAGVMRDAAQEAGIAFLDLGDVSQIIRFNDDLLVPAGVFDFVAKQLRVQHSWPGGITDYQHPMAAFHHRLGAAAYKQLSAEPAAMPWRVSATSTVQVEESKATVTTEIVNTTREPLVVAVQPLPVHAWVPSDKPSVLTLKPNEHHPLTIQYSRANEADTFQFPPVSAHEPVIRFPVFVGTATNARIEEIRATISPLALMWKLDSLFNQGGSFTIDNMLVNTSSKDLSGLNWTAEWAGQKKSGKLDLAAGKGDTLALTFDLPKDTGARRIASPVMINVNGPSVHLQWMRAIEASQNIGIDQDVPLTASSDTKGTALLRFDAEAKVGRFIFDLADLPLQNDAAGHALKAEIHIDARSYGKRLEVGSTDALIAQIGAEDGEGTVSPINPWAFGPGYAMRFNELGVGATLSTDTVKHRIFTITLPRSYLYLHEWALGNGNSQLGITAKITVTKSNEAFELSQNGRDRDDAESHIVLELTPKPTSRWAVIVW